MSEQAANDQQSVRIYAFGSWAKTELPAGADPTPLGQRLIDYLSGQYQGPLSADESRLLLEEFTAMERYRLYMVGELLKCGGELQQEASSSVRANDGPSRVSDLMQNGMNLGKYVAYSDAAQRVQNVINAVAIATHEANDKLTAERKARLEGKATDGANG